MESWSWEGDASQKLASHQIFTFSGLFSPNSRHLPYSSNIPVTKVKQYCNTAMCFVSYHFNYTKRLFIHWKCESESVSSLVVSDSLWSHRLQHVRLLYPWDCPGKNTAVGCHSLLQGSSQPRDWTGVSCIVGRFFYHLSHQGSPLPKIFLPLPLYIKQSEFTWMKDTSKIKIFCHVTKQKSNIGNLFFINTMKVKVSQYVWLFATLWTVAHQATLSMEFSRPEYWSG